MNAYTFVLFCTDSVLFLIPSLEANFMTSQLTKLFSSTAGILDILMRHFTIHLMTTVVACLLFFFKKIIFR